MLALVLVTTLLAIAAVLPLGVGAHAVAVRTAVPTGDVALAVAMACAPVGAAVAPLLVAAPRVRRLVSEARSRRDRARSELAAIAASAAVGGLGHAVIASVARDMASTTIGAGLGLLATSVAVGSIAIAPSPTRRTASPTIGALTALAITLGALPGGSPMALAIAALAWAGVAEPDAVEIAALTTVPAHAILAVRLLGEGDLAAAGDATAPAALAGAVGVGVACLALAGLRRWARERTVAGAALWTGALGLALLAHAYVAAS